MRMVGIVLAAGNGQRLSETCKPLLRIADRSLIEYSLENLFRLQVDKIFVVVGKFKPQIEAAIGKDYRGIPVQYILQPEPSGLVNAISKALGMIDDDAVLQLGDEIFVNAAPGRLTEKRAEGFDFVCGVTYETDEEKIKANYAVAAAEDMRIISCTEKPREVTNNMKGTGFCLFSRECMKLLEARYDEGENIPYDLCDFINMLTTSGLHGVVTEIAEREYNINTAEDVAFAKADLE